MFQYKKTVHKIWLNLGLRLTFFFFFAVLLLTFLQCLIFRSIDDLDLLQVNLTSFLASGASFLGRKAAKRYIKSDKGIFCMKDQFPD